MTPSIPCSRSASATASVSSTEARTNGTPAGTNFAIPEERSSRTTGVIPAALKARTMCAPMYPAPPVTIHVDVIGSSLLVASRPIRWSHHKNVGGLHRPRVERLRHGRGDVVPPCGGDKCDRRAAEAAARQACAERSSLDGRLDGHVDLRYRDLEVVAHGGVRAEHEVADCGGPLGAEGAYRVEHPLVLGHDVADAAEDAIG